MFLGHEPKTFEPRERMGTRHSKGADPEEWPESLRVRQWPVDAETGAKIIDLFEALKKSLGGQHGKRGKSKARGWKK